MRADTGLADLIDVATWMIPLYAATFLVGAAIFHAMARSRPDGTTALLWLCLPPSVWCASFFFAEQRWVTVLNLVLEPLLLGGLAVLIYVVAGLDTRPTGKHRVVLLFVGLVGVAAAMGALLPPFGEAL